MNDLYVSAQERAWHDSHRQVVEDRPHTPSDRRERYRAYRRVRGYGWKRGLAAMELAELGRIRRAMARYSDDHFRRTELKIRYGRTLEGLRLIDDVPMFPNHEDTTNLIRRAA